MGVILKGALIGGGVGAAIAAMRSPAPGQQDDKTARMAKSAAEGALAGAAVGFVLDRRLRRRAATLLASAPMVVDAVSDLAKRYEPNVEHLVEVARERAHDARERAVDAYEHARPRVEDAAAQVRSRALELRSA